MKLVTFRKPGGAPRPGVLTAKGIVDLRLRNGHSAVSVKQLLPALDALRKQLSSFSGVDYAATDVELLAPIPRPGKILALGLNYRDHAAEAGMELPKIQSWFAKMPTAVNGPYDPVHLPRVSDKLDYEAELAFVIGKRVRHATAQSAKDAIAGFCCANDVSVRDFQFHSTQFVVGKSFDTHCPFGPWLTSADEIPDPQNLSIQCSVNGEIRQDSNTSDMVFDVYQMVEYLSQAMTLEPGDLILTGTPAGVGAVRKPRLYLKPGDVVRVEVEGLGHLENRVTVEPS